MSSKKDPAEAVGIFIASLAFQTLALWGILSILGVSLSFWELVGISALAGVFIRSATVD